MHVKIENWWDFCQIRQNFQVRNEKNINNWGTGFIGANLVKSLANRKGLEVTATHFSRPPVQVDGVNWVRVDLTERESVNNLFETNWDCVIQAAAVTSGISDVTTRPHIHVTDNAIMNSLLFSAAWSTNVGHVIFFMLHNLCRQ